MPPWKDGDKEMLVNLVCEQKLKTDTVKWQNIKQQFAEKTVQQLQQTYQNMVRKDSDSSVKKVWSDKHTLIIKKQMQQPNFCWYKLRLKLNSFSMQEIMLHAKKQVQINNNIDDIPKDVFQLLTSLIQ